MSRSLNEIGTLCKRAARGAGLTWGQAEDAAHGARWLGAFDLPGPALLAARLSGFDGERVAGPTPASLDGPWRGANGRLCALAAGAAASDRAGWLGAGRAVEMAHVVCPLLCVPLVADAAVRLGAPVVVEWRGVRLTTDGRALGIEGDRGALHDEGCEHLVCRLAPSIPTVREPRRVRGRVAPDVWTCLSALAARTYAPATEASRRLGAGGADDG